MKNRYKDKLPIIRQEVEYITIKIRNLDDDIFQLLKERDRLRDEINNKSIELLRINNQISKLEKKKANKAVDLKRKQEIINEFSDDDLDTSSESNIIIEEEKETDKEECDCEKEHNKKYMEIGDAKYPVGLFNSVCKNPEAICDLKNCFLSYKDVRKRKCLFKMCKHLKWL